MKNIDRGHIFVLLFIAWLLFTFFTYDQVNEVYYYPTFLNYMEESKIESALVIGDRVQARLSDGTQIRTYKPSDINIAQLFVEHEIPFVVKPETNPTNYLSLLASLFLIGLVLFAFNSIRSRTNLHVSENKPLSHENPVDINFSHVAGIDEEKQELEEIVSYLKNPKKFQQLNARIPRGVLLVGPAGTGKTLLAKAVAGEAGVPFFSTSGSSFAEIFVGVGPARVRKLFEDAKKHAPCIVFIDEIDSMGKKRGTSVGNDERENTLNQLLVEMDGFDSADGVIVLAATNIPDILDPALLRPGRFDRQIFVAPPDLKGREAILKVHTKDKPIKDIDFELLARQTPGFTGADLANLVNEAALIAIRENQEFITMKHFELAIDRVIGGVEKPSKIISELEKKLVSYHEAGHALVAHILTNNVHKVSIIPRGQAGGFTMLLPDESPYASKNRLLNTVKILLAGRAAEELIFGEVTTGAQDDLRKSTNIVKNLIVKYGMSSFGPVTFEDDNVFKHNFSEHTGKKIDEEIINTLNACYEEAKKILIENRSKLNLLAHALMEKETLNASQVRELIGEMKNVQKNVS